MWGLNVRGCECFGVAAFENLTAQGFKRCEVPGSGSKGLSVGLPREPRYMGVHFLPLPVKPFQTLHIQRVKGSKQRSTRVPCLL